MAIALKSTTVTKIMPLIKVFELMMMMTVIVVPIIIIIIIVGMSIPNTQSRPKNAGGNHRKKTRTHTMPQAGRRETTPSTPTRGPHHPTTPQGGGNHWGGGEGGGRPNRDHIYIYMIIYMYTHLMNNLHSDDLVDVMHSVVREILEFRRGLWGLVKT